MKVNISPYLTGDEVVDRVIEVEVHPDDVISLDVTFAHLAAPLLKQLRKQVHSYPAEFYIEGDWEAGAQKWHEILSKMIHAFELIIEADSQDSCGAEDWRKRDIQIQEGLDLFAKYYRNLWD